MLPKLNVKITTFSQTHCLYILPEDAPTASLLIIFHFIQIYKTFFRSKYVIYRVAQDFLDIWRHDWSNDNSTQDNFQVCRMDSTNVLIFQWMTGQLIKQGVLISLQKRSRKAAIKSCCICVRKQLHYWRLTP